MGLFNQLKTENLEVQADRLGGFAPLPTDIYTGKIKAAYGGKSAKGALNVTLLVELNGKEYRETIYVSNQKGENFFLNKQDNSKKVPLPGFSIINDICMLTCEKQLFEMDTEEKQVKIYNPDTKTEEPKGVDMLMELLGKEISLAIFNNLEDKTKLNETSGEYEPTGETRETNNIEKAFHTDTKLTLFEAQGGKEAGEFWDAWLTKNKGIQRNKVKGGADNGKAAPRAAGAPQAGAAAPVKKSLFDKK